MLAFARIDDKPIRVRTQIYEPDYVVVLDPTLPDVVDVSSGVKQGGKVVLNSKKKICFPHAKCAQVDATAVAMETLGAAITNTAMLGAFAKATGAVKLESLIEVIKRYFPPKLVDKNVAAIKTAYERTEVET